MDSDDAVIPVTVEAVGIATCVRRVALDASSILPWLVLGRCVHLVGHSRCFTVGGCDVYMYGAGRVDSSHGLSLARFASSFRMFIYDDVHASAIGPILRIDQLPAGSYEFTGCGYGLGAVSAVFGTERLRRVQGPLSWKSSRNRHVTCSGAHTRRVLHRCSRLQCSGHHRILRSVHATGLSVLPGPALGYRQGCIHALHLALAVLAYLSSRRDS